ncbi:hypothetical protein JX265_001435 [Neoarthrinium moseri]|uniref:Methyltransferase domain-containing protein n=1 Tax=Neoarthrinium moseri TaxID=1658444 RepID=A0A9Q0ATB0_9PEZI|nr:hypothetical protein JX265_001435 [Neoarthrinium moseri]
MDENSGKPPEETSRSTPNTWSRFVVAAFIIGTITLPVGLKYAVDYLKYSARRTTGTFDPRCADPASDSWQATFELDLTFGQLSFSQAKLIDLGWDTIIGQGGRLLHGWILYRCVIKRFLFYTMERSTVSYDYFMTVWVSRSSLETLLMTVKEFPSIDKARVLMYSVLLVFFLGYTILFTVLWSTTTGYVNLSRKLYAMPNGDVIPLDSKDLAICWVLDSVRLGLANGHVELGPVFSELQDPFIKEETPEVQLCADIGQAVQHPTYRHGQGGWETQPTIWDQFNMSKPSANFLNLRAYTLSAQLLRIATDLSEWKRFGSSSVLDHAGGQMPSISRNLSKCTDQNSSLNVLESSIGTLQYVQQPTHAMNGSHVSWYTDVTGTLMYRSNVQLDNSIPNHPGIVPYNSTLWLNGTQFDLAAPFLDIGYGCTGPEPGPFTSLGNCICYRGEPIPPEFLADKRIICNTAPGFVWGFSSNFLVIGLILETIWLGLCLFTNLSLSTSVTMLKDPRARNTSNMLLALDFSEGARNDLGSIDVRQVSEESLRKALKGHRIGYERASGETEDDFSLNLMHHHWVKDFGYLIHPRIHTESANLKVADVGSGTGIWLLDAYDRLPKSTQFVGLDISFDAAPPPETFPANITFQKWDVRDPVPDELIAAFDIINVHFMVFVVLKDEVPLVVDKFIQMRKPGGYLQWVEPDNQTVHGELTKPGNMKTNIEQLMSLLKSQDPDLPKIFSDRGIADVDADVHTAPPHWAYLMHECGLIMHELIARKTQNEQMAAELKRLIPLAVEETHKGAYLATTKYAITGGKP